MKCLQVITNLGLGGGQNVMLSIIETLAPRIDFTVFAVQGVRDGIVGQGMLDRLTALGVRTISGTGLPIKRGGMITGGVSLAGHLRRNHYDIIHTHTEIPEAITAIALTLAPGLLEVPLVRSIHNTELWPAWSRVGAWVERRLSHGAVAAVSNGALAALRKFRARHGLAPLMPEAMRVILNGVRIPKAPSSARRPHRSVRLLYAGRFEAQKGADLLPKILMLASAQHQGKVHVDIVGQGSFAAQLAELPGLLNGRWTGALHAPDPGLAASLDRYDAVLMPSRFEGLPLLAVEALVAGTPVLLTDADGFADVVDAAYPLRARAGDAVVFSDMLVRFLSDPELYLRTADALRTSMIARFNVDRMADAYAAFYAEVSVAGTISATTLPPSLKVSRGDKM